MARMSKEDIAVIERIVRQQWYDESDPDEARLGHWLDVDQDQFLALIEWIPNRHFVTVRSFPFSAPACPTCHGEAEGCRDPFHEEIGAKS